jgi:predicted nucleotidyltransferase
MSEATTKRMALTERIALAYAANPKVWAVLLTGSVARGTADRFSDIDLDVFWAEPPSEAELQAPIERAGASLLYRDADENEMRVAPPDLAGRLRQSLRDEPRSAVREIHQLIEEISHWLSSSCPTSTRRRRGPSSASRARSSRSPSLDQARRVLFCFTVRRMSQFLAAYDLRHAACKL